MARASAWFLACLFITAVMSCATVSPTVPASKKQLAEAHYKLGLAHLAEDNLQPAFIEFQKTVAADPHDKAAWNLLGYIHTRLAKYEEAEAAFRKAISIDKEYSEAYNNLGVLYNHQGRWDDGIQQFLRALKNPLYETPQKALNNMGFAYMKKGDLANARTSFEQALMRGTIPQAHYNLAIVLKKLGQDEGAVHELQEALRESPGYVDAHWLLAQHYLDREQPVAAIPHLEAVARQLPNDERGKTAQRYLDLIERQTPGGDLDTQDGGHGRR